MSQNLEDLKLIDLNILYLDVILEDIFLCPVRRFPDFFPNKIETLLDLSVYTKIPCDELHKKLLDLKLEVIEACVDAHELAGSSFEFQLVQTATQNEEKLPQQIVEKHKVKFFDFSNQLDWIRANLESNKKHILISKDGRRSFNCAMGLRQLGYKNVFALAQGWELVDDFTAD